MLCLEVMEFITIKPTPESGFMWIVSHTNKVDCRLKCFLYIFIIFKQISPKTAVYTELSQFVIRDNLCFLTDKLPLGFWTTVVGFIQQNYYISTFDSHTSMLLFIIP